ncbi:3-hydroxyacyl-CoA dehydrogenase NAD-binding domain-containing protein [Sphingobium sp. 15-1]|uniref:3-hydroxyacyl-CoA dehydrogenase NAD-binding domain-containing protein n=1 Tax=Sphingobium sp. 15-1 TaxID=2729616 RepID=UPI00159C87B6|nr:3-hydroxyacyl-CoA dehydrogenase NAD-binding domain-containing protein [Sphingobium sp. 15-1]
MRHIRLDRCDDGMAILTLDNADESMNVVSQAWLDEMNEAIAAVKADDAIKGLVITSSKKVFMAGADLKFLVNCYGKMTAAEAYEFSQAATRMHRALETMGKPVAAAINGTCLGGGFELALACHYRVAVDDPKLVVGLPEVNVGLLPGSGGTQRLPRVTGVKVALDLLLSGRAVRSAEALKLKMVDAVVPADELIAKAKQLIEAAPDMLRDWDRKGFALSESRGMVLPETAAMFTMATAGAVRKAGYNLPAPTAILSCVFEGVQLPFDRALSIESKYFAKLLTHPSARNIIRTSFISKQAVEKGARRPEGFEKVAVKKVGILGAGMMGAGIALVAAQAGIDVVLIDRDAATAEKGKSYAAKVLGKALERGSTTQEAVDAVRARILPTPDYGPLADVDLVIEAVFEDVAIKADVTRRAEAVIPATAIFATNTSTLPISNLSQASTRPDQFIGMHFFSPVDRMALVEVIRGKRTSDETLAKGLDFIAQIRKTPIVVNDSRGFYTSRVYQTLINEGAAMLADGVKPALIENAARSAGFPVGPLALLDETSMDLPIKIVEQAIEQEGPQFVPPPGMPVMYRMRDIGRTSRKSGKGFYDYPDSGKKRLWPGLAEVFPPSDQQPSVEQLKTRLFYAQAIETARCIEEGVIETPEDADIGAVYGWGFPLWTGGPISYIDTVGIEHFVREADRLAQRYGARFAPSAWLREKAASGTGFYADAKEKQACAA